MITIICGLPGVGKTSLSCAIACNTMIYDRQRYINCCESIAELNADGYNIVPPQRQHAVACNFGAYAFNKDCTGKLAYFFDPYKFVLPNKDISYDVVYPYFEYHITEGQAVYDSRKSKSFNAACSRLYENHRHNNLDIYIDCQRFMLIDSNIRDIAQFIYVLDMEQKHNISGEIVKTIWHGYLFKSPSDLQNYLNCGKPKNAENYKYVFEGDILLHFNSFENKKAFYKFDKSKKVIIDELSKIYEQQDIDYLSDTNNFRGVK